MAGRRPFGTRADRRPRVFECIDVCVSSAGDSRSTADPVDTGIFWS